MLTQQKHDALAEGMEVYDKDGARIGTIKALRHGEGTIKAQETDIVTMANTISECLGGEKNLPTILYSRLYEKGFICIERGFLRKDLIAFTDQIRDVAGESVFLKVEQNLLIKI